MSNSVKYALVGVLVLVLVGYFVWKNKQSATDTTDGSGGTSAKDRNGSSAQKWQLPNTPSQKCVAVKPNHPAYTGGPLSADVEALLSALSSKWRIGGANAADYKSRVLGFFKAINVQPANAGIYEYYKSDLLDYMASKEGLLFEQDVVQGWFRCVPLTQ